MKGKIKKIIEEVLKTAGIPAVDFNIEYPPNPRLGDYSCNVAFRLSKIWQKSPSAIAVELKEKIKSPLIKRIDAVNGYLNFFLEEAYYLDELKTILRQKQAYAKGKRRGKVQVEFISANPTGPLHLGNGRGGFLGDCLANVLTKAGYQIQREFYINDFGHQADLLGESVIRAYLLRQGIKIDYPDELYHGEYIKDLARQLELKHWKLQEIQEMKEEVRDFAVGEIIKQIKELTEKKMKIKFDRWFSEKSLYQGRFKEKVLAELKKKKLIYEKDGALWFKSQDFGDEKDRVIQKADGAYTYFFSDILYFWNKFKIRKFKKVIDIWGADHHGYVLRMQAMLKALDHGGQFDVILVQLVRLVFGGKELKMSKRAGTFVTLEELINDVGLDVGRWFFLQITPETQMDFDLELARQKSQENPVYYVQYAHARICSILKRIQNSEFKIQNSYQYNEVEFNLIKKLAAYYELIEEVAANYNVSRLPQYVLELARQFHDFYEKCRVISEGRVIVERLNLIKATRIILADVLKLMGISAPEKMEKK